MLKKSSKRNVKNTKKISENTRGERSNRNTAVILVEATLVQKTRTRN